MCPAHSEVGPLSGWLGGLDLGHLDFKIPPVVHGTSTTKTHIDCGVCTVRERERGREEKRRGEKKEIKNLPEIWLNHKCGTYQLTWSCREVCNRRFLLLRRCL